MLVSTLTAASLPAVASAGRLDRAGQNLRQSDGSSDDRQNADNDWHDDDDDDEFDAEAAALMMWVFTAPWHVPYSILSARYPTLAGFSDYPYADGNRGHMRVSDPPDGRAPRTAFRVGVLGAVHDPQLWSSALEARVELSAPIVLRAGFRWLRESGLETTTADPSGTQQAALAGADALLRFAESPRLNFYTGFGYRQWNDRLGMVPGLAGIYGFEAYPGRPISFGSEVSIGVQGQGYLLQWRTYVGLVLGRAELRAGYDHVDVDGALLGGPMLGVEVHL